MLECFFLDGIFNQTFQIFSFQVSACVASFPAFLFHFNSILWAFWCNRSAFITSVRAGTIFPPSVLIHFIYLITRVMLRHNKTSRRSPQPPLPFRIFCFLITLATVSMRFLGNSWPAFVATLMTCCTFEITWFDSQLFFLWWTPLKSERRLKQRFEDQKLHRLTIHRCGKLSGLEQPSRTTSSSSIGGSCVGATSPSCSRHSRRSI